MKYILLFLALTSCAPPLKHHKQFTVAPAILPYVFRFEEEAAKHSRPIHIDNLIASGMLAYCQVGGMDTPLIKVVDTEFWDHASDASREHLIFHELGHCILGREHLDTEMVFGPASIMNTYLFDDETYLRNHDYYMQELFK